MRNRTADLLLTMETLCLLSYRGTMHAPDPRRADAEEYRPGRVFANRRPPAETSPVTGEATREGPVGWWVHEHRLSRPAAGTGGRSRSGERCVAGSRGRSGTSAAT